MGSKPETDAIVTWIRGVCGGNQARVALAMGMNISTFRNRLSKGHVPFWFVARFCHVLGIEKLDVRATVEEAGLSWKPIKREQLSARGRQTLLDVRRLLKEDTPGTHPGEETLLHYAQSEAASDEILSHLVECEDCARRVLEMMGQQS